MSKILFVVQYNAKGIQIKNFARSKVEKQYVVNAIEKYCKDNHF